MSTKIFNGYRLPMMTVNELQDFCGQLRKQLTTEAERLYRSFYALNLIGEQDAYLLNSINGTNLKPVTRTRIMFGLFSEVMDRQRKIQREQTRDPEVDFSFEATFIPCEQCILALIYTEQATMKELWESKSDVEEYFYFNNTDKPKHVAKNKWEQRRIDWDKALGDGIPAEVGLSGIFVPVQFAPITDPELILEYQPELEQRLLTQSKYAVLHDAMQKELIDPDYPDETPMKSYFNSVKFVKSEEGQILVAEKVRKFRDILPERYTVDAFELPKE